MIAYHVDNSYLLPEKDEYITISHKDCTIDTDYKYYDFEKEITDFCLKFNISFIHIPSKLVQYVRIPYNVIDLPHKENRTLQFVNVQDILLKDYLFFPGVDQMNYDISFKEDKLDVITNQPRAFAAFNTLGYFKSTVKDLKPSKYFNCYDGIYVNKNYYYYKFKDVKKKKYDTTELCYIMKNSDKSSLNIYHCYTPVYSQLFESMRNKPIKLAEIGVYRGESVKGWLEYFPNANVYGYDNDYDFLEEAEFLCNSNKRLYLEFINISDKEIIDKCLADKHFDVIIDDSSHVFNDQIIIINVCSKYTDLLIIENIPLFNINDYYISEMSDYVLSNFKYEFIYPYNDTLVDPYNNNKMLILTRH